MQKALYIKRIQWLAIGLMSLPEIYFILYNTYKLIFGTAPINYTNEIYSIVSLIITACTFAAYTLLSRIATNSATGKVTRVYGFVTIGLVLFRFWWFVYFKEVLTSNIAHELVPGIMGPVSIIYFLYWLGVVERTNAEIKQTRVMLKIMFIAYLIFINIPQFYPLLFPSSMVTVILVTNILNAISLILIYYFLFTSEAFCGATDTTLVSKGSYKFWNRYFAVYLIVLLVVNIIAGVLGFILDK